MEVVWSRRLKEFICDRDDFVFYAIWYLKPVKTWELQRRHEQVSFEYAGGDLIGLLEDHNIVNYSNQAWSEQNMCQ